MMNVTRWAMMLSHFGFSLQSNGVLSSFIQSLLGMCIALSLHVCSHQAVIPVQIAHADKAAFTPNSTPEQQNPTWLCGSCLCQRTETQVVPLVHWLLTNGRSQEVGRAALSTCTESEQFNVQIMAQSWL